MRVADLAMYAREVVPRRTRDRQHPILNFERADNFILAYYAGGETEPKGLPFEGEPEIEAEPGAFNQPSTNNSVIQVVTQKNSKYNINMGIGNPVINDSN